MSKLLKSVKDVARELLIEASNAALEHFRSAVKPIYGAGENGDPFHIGTAILLELPEGRFLLTAAHVIDWNSVTTLYLGEKHFEKLEFEASVSKAPGDDRSKDRADFAIARLDEALLAKLSGAKFISEAEISPSVANTEGRTYTCLGYPNSKNKISRHKSTTISPAIGIYTSLGRPASKLPNAANDSDHILVDFNAKYSRDASGAKVNSIALPGFSGGAIIDVGRISADSLNAPSDPKLAALLIEGHRTEQVIIGTRIAKIVKALRQDGT